MKKKKKKNPSTPFTFGKCSSLAIALMMLKFWKNILNLLNYFFLKFEIDPMVHLKGTTILVKNLEACSWKSFHELPLQLLITNNFLLCFFCLHTFASMNNISSHITTSFPFTHSLSSSSQKKHKIKKNSSPPSFLWPLLLFSLSNGSCENPSLQLMASPSFMNQWE